MKIQLHSYKVNYSGPRRRLAQAVLFLVLSDVLFCPAYHLENKPFIIINTSLVVNMPFGYVFTDKNVNRKKGCIIKIH